MKTRTYTAIAYLVSVVAASACGGRRQAQEGAAADPGAPTPAVTAPGTQAANLGGSWALRAGDGTRRGPLLELVIDSVGSSAFRVRVTFLMSGDVGIDPGRFQPTAGTVGPTGVVRFALSMRDQTEPLGEMSGTVERDTIRLQTFKWAGEDQTAGGTRWLLVKQP